MIKKITIKLPRQSGKSTMIEKMALGMDNKQILIISQNASHNFKNLNGKSNIKLSCTKMVDFLLGQKFDVVFFDDYDLFPINFSVEAKIFPSMSNDGVVFFIENDYTTKNIKSTNFNNNNSIINSLKRLERIGDDNSKTAQKLINSANEIGNKIVEIFKNLNYNPTNLDLNFKNDKFDYFIKDFKYASPMLFNEKRKVAYYDFQPIQCSDSDQSIFLSQYKQCNVEEAIFLAKDLKNGLLDFIYETIECSTYSEMNNDMEEALSVFNRIKSE